MGQDGGAICGALRQTESAAHEGRCGASQVQTGNVVGAGVRASPSDSSNADRSIQFRCVSVRFDAMERGRRKAKPRRGTQRASNASNSDNGSPAMTTTEARLPRAGIRFRSSGSCNSNSDCCIVFARAEERAGLMPVKAALKNVFTDINELQRQQRNR